jgi:UDP-N-acetyl-D-glucosamine dehydrogenase
MWTCGKSSTRRHQALRVYEVHPRAGPGGHCIPIDPLYLSWKLRSLKYTARFIDLASEINSNMPRFTVSKIQDALNDDAKPLSTARC